MDGPDGARGLVVAVGVVLILVGVGFKLAVVPFHMWTPDVYQGAPAPVTAFVATVSKGAVFAVLLRFFGPLASPRTAPLFVALAVIAIASMVAGNLLALRQDNVKRLLAYSSIAHLGYLLVAFLAGVSGPRAVDLLPGGLLRRRRWAPSGWSRRSRRRSGTRTGSTTTAAWPARRPALAAAFAVALFSLAGIPLTAGFIGKFYVVTAGAAAALWALVVVLVARQRDRPLLLPAGHRGDVRAAAGGAARAATSAATVRASGAVLAALVAIVLAAGVYPAPLIDLIERAVAALP